MFFLVMGLWTYDCMFTDCLPKTFEHVYDVECYREATQVIKPLFHKMSSLTVQLTGPAEIPYHITPMMFCLTSFNGLAQICLPVQSQTWRFTFKGPIWPKTQGHLYYGLHNETARLFKTHSVANVDFVVPQKIQVNVKAEINYL